MSYLASIASIKMLDLKFTVHLSADFSSNLMPFIIEDLVSVAVPQHVGLGHAVAAHLQCHIIVVLDGLLLEGLCEHWCTGCGGIIGVKVSILLRKGPKIIIYFFLAYVPFALS